MGSIAVNHLAWNLPGGAELFRDVSFNVGNGDRVALVGANGVGKTTLFRLIIGDENPSAGTVSVDGGLGVMHQLVGTADHPATTVRELLLSISPARIRAAADDLDRAHECLADDPMAYATAVAAWSDVGGYDAEVLWDECTTRAFGESFDEVAHRPLRTLSGGEQKRLALETLLRSEFEILVLDEPDNFLDVPAKRWLEQQLNETRKTVVFISHDRELLAASATKIVTIDAAGAWTHGGSFATYAAAKEHHDSIREHNQSLYDAEKQRLEDYVKLMRQRASISEAFAPKLKAAETKLRHFVEKNERPPDVAAQKIDVQLRGARTGKRAVICEQLEISGLTDPFDLELWYGERVAVLGGNGVGKSHFLRLLASAGSEGARHDGPGAVEHDGVARLGAGVRPGLFHQTHEHPEWSGRELVDILHDLDVMLGPAMGMLRRYELQPCARQTFETLSGGQQARFQILLLELSGATLLLLDEPTDNLDLVSAEALEHGLAHFNGTVVTVTHDRWFLRGFDRFVVFGDDCRVTDHTELPATWAD
ncbi:ABC-F family ATP-binding cassette domain-containing protein [Ilumatobacter nonamiensis]|uniref:ABC-F family ATP-binding cassette domain-containing protein n=1 Tax=Ilumatobacter nonamiensis TaxID=467093 RepID=UPI00034A31B5|nr:ATP-binding cassette domain-containing protein [Ilumatobacter nonamiensis]